MEIRPATEQDIPFIVSLLKQSLGESLMPKSEVYWRWKHIENPFGSSPVLVSEEGGQLTGVRAFMRWQWKTKDRVYHAVRAVDTATHPAYQGKGIFKKLTLSLVDECTKAGDDFIFNTPNHQSKPGYLKMGWEMAGKLPVTAQVNHAWRILSNAIRKPQCNITPTVDGDDLKAIVDHPGLQTLLEEHNATQSAIHTHYSAAYIKWRYQQVPVASYTAVAEEQDKLLNGLIIGRLKYTRFGLEFRITDHFVSPRGTDELHYRFWEHIRSLKADYVTMSGTVKKSAQKIMRGITCLKKLPIGPDVTVRKLNLKTMDELSKFKNWSPSLGDLELF